MRINGLKARLQALEARLIKRSAPWPPTPGSLAFHLWDAIGRPGERRKHLDMYLAAGAKFWEERK